jgi:protein ImuB
MRPPEPAAPAGRAPGTAARYACGWVPGFAAQALVRQDPTLRDRPVAALTGTELRTVVAVTPAAAAGGVRPGMSATEAATRVPALVARPADAEAERVAAAALLDAAWAVSPRVERVDAGCLCLDVSGLGALLGDDRRVGERLAAAGAAVGLPVRVGVASTRTTAGLAARAAAGVTVVPAGAEPAFLAPLPLALLEPAPDLALALERWGVRTLGALGALPAAALLARLGPPGTALRTRARGEDAAPFVPCAWPEPCVEALALDWEVAALPALAFVLDRLLARLAVRLALRDAGATALTLTLGLADGGRHVHRLALAAPVQDGRTLRRLLVAAIDAVRLPAAVVAVAVEAQLAPIDPLQTDLFAPPRPSPRELGETLGRLAALVGPARVGAPVAPDTHRPDARTLAPFTGGLDREARAPWPAAAGPAPLPRPAGARGTGLAGDDGPAVGPAASLVRRRLVPPRPARIDWGGDGRPARVDADGCRGAVVAAAGPWRTAGEWWTETAWAREEWDVALPDGAVYRLARDLATDTWTVDAVYD